MRSKYELKAHKDLVTDGYQVDYKIRPSKFPPKGYQVDFLGMFDLLAYKDGVLRMIAIKGHVNAATQIKPLIEAFTPTQITKEVWFYKKDGTIRKVTL